MSSLEYKLFITSTAIALTLAIFSYAYVDLNLTLTQNTTVLDIISRLQHFGYYERPNATTFYLILIIALYANYAINLFLFIKQKLSLKYLLISTLSTVVILVPSYPFLSSDLFNYMFDSKIITVYHLNPYAYKPLDFPNDDWIRFMRWTHRYSPYGPLWLIYSTIPALLGLQKFLLTFLTFKIFIGVFHLLNTLYIFKTLQKINRKLSVVGAATYGLNPLFLIEGVANAHNDIVHAFPVILSVYFLSRNRYIAAALSITTGTFIKYLALITYLPQIVAKFTKLNKIEYYIYLNLLLYFVFTVLFSTFRLTVPFISSGSLQTQFQPWYLFWTLPLVSFLPHKNVLLLLSTVIGFSALLRYIPFIYFGDWSHPQTVLFMQAIIVILPSIAILSVLLNKYREKIYK